MKKLIFSIFLMLFLIGTISAFSLQKQLVQLQVDENYPCHIENGNTIVCPALNSIAIDEWKNEIQSTLATIDDGTGKQIVNPEKDIGSLKDTEKVGMLLTNAVPYEKAGNSKTIDLTKEYREVVNPLTLDSNELIKIGFATNVFGVSGTPLENFDVNTTTGMVRYRPLNMTWLNFTGGNQYIGNIENLFNTNGNLTYSVWVKTNSGLTTKQQIVSIGGDGRLFINNSGTIFSYRNATNTYHYIYGAFINDSLWHHIVATQDIANGNSSLYIDNVLQGSSINGTLQTGSLGQLALSWSVTGFYGGIDEFRVYNATLTQVEITELYNSGRIKNSSLNNSKLNVWFSFNENNGNIVIGKNKTINNGNFTLTGATWQSDNINVTTLGYQVNISIVNITNALVFWDNYTLITNQNSSNMTFSFLNNQSVYVLENYQLNEATPTTYSPIWFSSSTDTEKNIASNLSDNVNVSVIISSGIDCDDYKLIEVKYTTNGGTETTWTSSDAKNICNQFKTTGVYLIVEPASSSGVIEFTYQCDNMSMTGFKLVMIFASLIIIIFLVYNIKLEGMTVGNIITIFITIIVALSLWLASGQNLGSACGAVG